MASPTGRPRRPCFGIVDPGHPGVDHLLKRSRRFYVAGELEGLQAPAHYDYRELRHTPAELRGRVLAARGWRKIVAFQTRNPLHRAHFELTLRAAMAVEANLLIHPVVGMTKPGDVDHYTRVRCYQAIMPSYPPGTAMLSLLPLAMRMGGPREALLHAIIRRNHGVTHLIVGRDHAGPGKDSAGRPFYGPYDAQEMVSLYEDELGVQMVPFKEMVYVEDRDLYMPDDEVPKGSRVLSISGTEQRRRLNEGTDLPSWFTPPAVAAELRRSYPPRSTQGFTLFFTGLSGSGKSTIANAVLVKLLEIGGRPVTLLDGDIVQAAAVVGARLLQGAPRPQHPAHRLRRLGDHGQRRHRDLRADRALRRHPQRGAEHDRAARRLRPDPRRDADRGVRGAGPQGSLREGASGNPEGVHRESQTLTRFLSTPT